MGKLLRLTAFALVLSLTAGCSKEPGVTPNDEPHRLVGEYLSFSYSADELTAGALGEYTSFPDIDPSLFKAFIQVVMKRLFAANQGPFGQDNADSWHLEQHQFEYRSITATGDSATLSGSVIYAQFNDSGKRPPLDGLTLFNDKVKLNDYVGRMGYENAARAILNHAVVTSDIEGFGVLRDRPVPYFDAYTKGRQTIDAAIAAKELLAAKGLTFKSDAKTWNYGVSLGGHQALGALKYYESDQCPESVRRALPNFNTFATVCPIDIGDLFGEYLNQDKLRFPFTVLMMVSTVFAVCPEASREFRFRDFLSDTVNARAVTVDGVTYPVAEGFEKTVIPRDMLLNLLLETTDGHMRQILSPDIFDSDGNFDVSNPKSRYLLEAMDKVKLSEGWYPAHHTYMSYSPSDEAIYYNSVKDKLDAFISAGADIELTGTSGLHSVAGALSVVDFMTLPEFQ